VQYKDSGRILTVLTSDLGKLTVSARGAMRKNSRVAAVVQPLAFSDMTLARNKDRWTLTEAQSIELFSGLSEDLSLLSLGAYFAELLEAVTDEDSPNPELLSLGLNALYLLCRGGRENILVKASFEMRLMCLSGFAPSLDACASCGKTELAAARLALYGGTLLCPDCSKPEDERTAPLCKASLPAMRHICACGAKKLFSFTLSAAALGRLGAASEAYLLAQLDRRFQTLDYYKNIKD
jgi:DNA repair protein RecO (recombination protein O)